jgi:membrane protein YqaA with SNARE-associated domain
MRQSNTHAAAPRIVIAAEGGILEVRFRAFLAIGLVGRLLRFVTIAVLAALA